MNSHVMTFQNGKMIFPSEQEADFCGTFEGCLEDDSDVVKQVMEEFEKGPSLQISEGLLSGEIPSLSLFHDDHQVPHSNAIDNTSGDKVDKIRKLSELGCHQTSNINILSQFPKQEQQNFVPVSDESDSSEAPSDTYAI